MFKKELLKQLNTSYFLLAKITTIYSKQIGKPDGYNYSPKQAELIIKYFNNHVPGKVHPEKIGTGRRQTTDHRKPKAKSQKRRGIIPRI